MRALDFPLLTDEDIHPEVVAGLRARGRDTVTALELGLGGRDDRDILDRAFPMGRVVVTHDADFGELVVRKGVPVVGIVYLRPGHVRSAFVLEMLDAIRDRAPEVTPPFPLVAARRGDVIRIRVRAVGRPSVPPSASGSA